MPASLVKDSILNSREAEQAMPLDAFVDETMTVLGTDANEILVEGARLFRGNPGPSEHDLVNGFNTQMMAVLAG